MAKQINLTKLSEKDLFQLRLPLSAPFETFVPGAATSMLLVREADANFPEAAARPPDAALDDAADHSTGRDAQGAPIAN